LSLFITAGKIPREGIAHQFRKFPAHFAVISSIEEISQIKNQIILVMEAKEAPMYTNIAPNPQGKLLLTSQVRKEDEPNLTVAIY
jgi:hypothetical protein